MRKEEKRLKCTLLNGAWSTETKYMRGYTGKCDVFGSTDEKGGTGGTVQSAERSSTRSMCSSSPSDLMNNA